MKAVVYEKYGSPDVLRLKEVARPTPEDNEVLIKVHATTVNRTDCGFRDPVPFFVRLFSGLLRPRKPILGTELAGVVEAVGNAVTRFAGGDEVFGVNADRFGAHAEFLCMREDAPLALKPVAMSFEDAAAVSDGFILALTCLRHGDVQKGQRVLIYGASGSIGTAAVQLARYFEADITAACNTANVEVVRSLGADRVIDYTEDDFTDASEPYDVIFDAVGKSSFRRCRHALKRGGIYLTTDLGYVWQNPILALVTRLVGSKRVSLPIPKYRQAEVLLLKELIEAGQYRAVVDRRYPLDQVVEATTYVETQQKTGNVVLTVIS